MVKSLASQAILVHESDALREAELAATQALLGTTIALDDAQWYGPSRLPGWSRAHVVTHLARGADAFARLITAGQDGTGGPLYDGEPDRWDRIEAGSHRTPLELQTDLDASVGRLLPLIALVPDLAGQPAQLWPDQPVRFELLPLAQISEVVLHHLDLDDGFAPSDIDPLTAAWLLQWHAFWLAGDPAYPSIELIGDSGLRARVGVGHHRIRAAGTDADLLCWLTGRQHPSQFGAQHLPALPLRR